MNILIIKILLIISVTSFFIAFLIEREVLIKKLKSWHRIDALIFVNFIKEQLMLISLLGIIIFGWLLIKII